MTPGRAELVPRQREEASGAGFAVCVLFHQIGSSGSSKHCGLGKEAFQTFPGSFSVAPSAASGERASKRRPGLAGMGDGAWAGATHPQAMATALPGARGATSRELAYAFCFACASPSAALNPSALAKKQVLVP